MLFRSVLLPHDDEEWLLEVGDPILDVDQADRVEQQRKEIDEFVAKNWKEGRDEQKMLADLHARNIQSKRWVEGGRSQFLVLKSSAHTSTQAPLVRARTWQLFRRPKALRVEKTAENID